MKHDLKRRFTYASLALLIAGALALGLELYYPLKPPSFIPLSWHMPMVYLLVGYKTVELAIFYFWLIQRAKRCRLYLYLVPQGSIVFGFLAYKLSGSVGFVYLFLAIALLALWLPKEEVLSCN